MKIVHIGMDHRVDDVRIAYKECSTLAQYNDVVYITLAYPGTKNIGRKHLKLIELPIKKYSCSRLTNPLKYFFLAKNRNKRIFTAIYEKAIEEHADIYHIHEYGLLVLGLKLKRETGAKIVYDIHEDYPRQLENSSIGKTWLFSVVKKAESIVAEKKENSKAKQFDYLICATPHIQERFEKINRCETVCNYPIIEEKISKPTFNEKSNSVCYVGTVFKARGITELVKAINETMMRLKLAGNISEDYRQELCKMPGWSKVDWLGFQDREGVRKTITDSLAGMVTLLPYGNIINALPVKMFEYMRYGIPVIASDFPVYREIIRGNNCGLCVDPYDIGSISDAIKYLASNRDVARQMGQNGYNAIMERYNWDVEQKKLIKVYDTLEKEINNAN